MHFICFLALKGVFSFLTAAVLFPVFCQSYECLSWPRERAGMMPGPVQPVLGSAGKGGESRAGGCPVLQEGVCMGEAESVSFTRCWGFLVQ